MKAAHNPFRSSSVEQIRYALSPENLEALVDHALADNCTCLLGPKGTGKTTLLEDLDLRLQVRGLQTHWIRLQIESTRLERSNAIEQLKQISQQQVCLFDGAEVLNFWQWRRVRQVARSNQLTLIATLHRKRGLPILLRTQPDWSLVHQFVRQLAGPHYSDTLCKYAQHAFDTSGGNMREVFRACYLALAQDNPREF